MIICSFAPDKRSCLVLDSLYTLESGFPKSRRHEYRGRHSSSVMHDRICPMFLNNELCIRARPYSSGGPLKPITGHWRATKCCFGKSSQEPLGLGYG